MNRPQTTGNISTRSLDVAAFIIAATSVDCSIAFTDAMAAFSFPSDISTRDALVSYETGGEVEGRKLLEIRNQLYRRIRGGGK